MSSLVHLICGSTGAGKTTYALRLSDRLGATRFSIDEWMAALFWMDSPQPLDPAWSMERVERCLKQIWAVVLQVAARGSVRVGYRVRTGTEPRDFVEGLWEPPTDAEMLGYNGIRTSGT